ncbi:phage antirepressor KilAC domain-containing protein [Paraburkholderia sediminicola]|uniref:phage antirepressor n=1 Tax=Paraburkholderia sediminicola TaxID=458836 RepID=UPI0038BAE914
MNQVIPFSFGMESVRVVVIDGEPFFVARDVALVLGYERTADAIRVHCKGSVKRRLPTAGGAQDTTLIPERDVYRLVMRSKLPAAERFEEWVVGEVLPAIRTTGAYGGAPVDLNDPATLRTALLTYTEKVIALEATIEQNAPAVEFAHTVRNMDGTIDMARMARVIGWGRNRLFATLRAEGILMDSNLPYQSMMDRGYFTVIEGTRERSDGAATPTFATRVTGKGQVFLQRRYTAKAA